MYLVAIFANRPPVAPVCISATMVNYEQTDSGERDPPPDQLATTDSYGMTLVMHAARSGNVAILGAVLKRIIDRAKVRGFGK